MARKLRPAPRRYGVAVLPHGCRPIGFLSGCRVPSPGEVTHMPPLPRGPGTLDGVLHRKQIHRSTIVASLHSVRILSLGSCPSLLSLGEAPLHHLSSWGNA